MASESSIAASGRSLIYIRVSMTQKLLKTVIAVIVTASTESTMGRPLVAVDSSEPKVPILTMATRVTFLTVMERKMPSTMNLNNSLLISKAAVRATKTKTKRRTTIWRIGLISTSINSMRWPMTTTSFSVSVKDYQLKEEISPHHSRSVMRLLKMARKRVVKTLST